jgi:hypothetical protein
LIRFKKSVETVNVEFAVLIYPPSRPDGQTLAVFDVTVPEVAVFVVDIVEKTVSVVVKVGGVVNLAVFIVDVVSETAVVFVLIVEVTFSVTPTDVLERLADVVEE